MTLFTQISNLKDSRILNTDTTRKRHACDICIKNKGNRHTEKEVVKDLLFSLSNTRDAYAIAANQRGFDFPIFVVKFDLDKASMLPFAHDMISVDTDTLSIALKVSPSVFKDPSIELVEGTREYASRESCLSSEGMEYTTKRYYQIRLHAKMLDIEAFRRNKNNLAWKSVILPLSGLASQIVQHEVDHLHGMGPWSFNFL